MAGSDILSDATKGRLRSFTHRSRYRTTSLAVAGDWAGSNSSLTGSMHSLLDSSKLMSMQEDARLHKISSEVLKQNLYKSVTAPYRRRHTSMRSCLTTPSARHYDDETDHASGSWRDEDPSMPGWWSYDAACQGKLPSGRVFQSLPVTPANSLAATPDRSPTSHRQFLFGFLSRGATPRCTSPETMEFLRGDDCVGVAEAAECVGLASIFSPLPRYISASRGSSRRAHGFASMRPSHLGDFEEEEMCDDRMTLSAPARKPAVSNGPLSYSGKA